MEEQKPNVCTTCGAPIKLPEQGESNEELKQEEQTQTEPKE